MNQQDITFTQTGVIRRNNKNAVCVRFERKSEKGMDYAEGFVPECKIIKNSGFTPEEVDKLEEYITQEKAEIIQKAKEMSNFLKILGDR